MHDKSKTSRLQRILLTALATLGTTLSLGLNSATAADPIVRDAEFYILQKQHGEQWAMADKDLDAQLADFRGMRAGTLRIAVVTTSKYFIPHLLGSFCDKYPDIDLQFRVGNREQIVERLHAGLDDLYVFSHPPENEDIAASDFLPNPLVAIAPEGHPLAQSKTLQLADLAEHPFLMREPGSGTRFAIERFFRKTDVQLSVRMTIESNEAIKHAVMSGLGISILSAHTLAFGGRAGLCELKVKGLPIEARWYLVQQRQRSTSIPARAFLEYMYASGQVEALMKELSIGSK